MIRIAIVEDERHYKEQLVDYLHTFEQEENVKIEIGLIDRMSAAEEIRIMDPKVVIIFITNMPQFAIKGYAVDALDYILKPISYFQFSERLKRAIDRMDKRETHYFTIRLNEGV